jgi:surfeit locus 1 family protein
MLPVSPLQIPPQRIVRISASFRPTWIPTIAAIVTIAATARLGFWQLDRAHQKEALQAQYERMRAAPVLELGGAHTQAERYRRVAVSGEFDTQHEILLDNQVHQGMAGYHVLTPLRIAAGDKLVMVNRGWIGRIKEYPSIPDIPSELGTITITGITDRADRSLIELSADTVQGNVWQNFTARRFRERTGIELLNFVILQQDPPGNALVRVKAEPEFTILRHYGYAFQWFALAATALTLYVVFTYKHARARRSQTQQS